MQRKLIAFVLALAGLSACSRDQIETQKTLARSVANADRVIVTNTVDRLSLAVSEHDVKMILDALVAAKRERRKIASTGTGHRLDFFKGTNHLGSVQTSQGIFWIRRQPYIDQTETLDALYQKARIEHYGNQRLP